MQNNINKMQLGIWTVFTALLAVALAVNAVQALCGTATLAVWHYPTLALGFMFVWGELPRRTKARIIIGIHKGARQAAKAILSASTWAVGCLAALFHREEESPCMDNEVLAGNPQE